MPKGYVPFKSSFQKVTKIVDSVRKWDGENEKDVARWDPFSEGEDEAAEAYYAKQWDDWKKEPAEALDCDG